MKEEGSTWRGKKKDVVEGNVAGRARLGGGSYGTRVEARPTWVPSSSMSIKVAQPTKGPRQECSLGLTKVLDNRGGRYRIDAPCGANCRARSMMRGEGSRRDGAGRKGRKEDATTRTELEQIDNARRLSQLSLMPVTLHYTYSRNRFGTPHAVAHQLAGEVCHALHGGRGTRNEQRSVRNVELRSKGSVREVLRINIRHIYSYSSKLRYHRPCLKVLQAENRQQEKMRVHSNVLGIGRKGAKDNKMKKEDYRWHRKKKKEIEGYAAGRVKPTGGFCGIRVGELGRVQCELGCEIGCELGRLVSQVGRVQCVLFRVHSTGSIGRQRAPHRGGTLGHERTTV